MTEGARLAVEEINAAGGIGGRQLELVIEDWGSENQKAVTAANKLIEIDHVSVIVGQWTGDVASYLPVTDSRNVTVMCAGCGAPGFTKLSSHLYRVWPSDGLEVEEVIKFAKSKGLSKPGILYTVDPWSEGLRDYFKSHWDGDIFSTAVSPDQQDFATELLSLKNAGVDLIYIPGFIVQVPQILKQAHELGLNTILVGTSASADPTVFNSAFSEGFIFPAYKPSDSSFISAYNARYGQSPGAYADAAYDSIKVIALGLKNGGGLETNLLGIKDFSGASGSISFDNDRDRVGRELSLKVIKGGQVQDYVEAAH